MRSHALNKPTQNLPNDYLSPRAPITKLANRGDRKPTGKVTKKNRLFIFLFHFSRAEHPLSHGFECQCQITRGKAKQKKKKNRFTHLLIKLFLRRDSSEE